MKLEGSIDAFGLPDILQLLAATQKSGALRIQQELATADGAGAQISGVVRLAEGSISGASSDLSRQSLARRVVGAALVGDDVLSAAVEQVQFAGSGGVVRALITAGAITEEEVLPVARLQTTDAVCELLRWTAGNFSFRDAEADPDNLPLRLPVEELVAEGQRRLATWPALTALIPSSATVLSLSIAPSTDPVCSREEWALLALVDGRRTVAEIVTLLGAGEYAIVRALAALVERGLLVNSAGGNYGISGLADLERRQGLLSVLETGQPIPQPRATADAAPAPAAVTAVAVTPAPVTADAPVASAAPAEAAVDTVDAAVPGLAAAVIVQAPAVEAAAPDQVSFAVADIPVAAVPEAVADVPAVEALSADAAQPRSGEFVGTTFQLATGPAAEAPAPVDGPVPVVAESAEPTTSAPGNPTVPPVTMETMGSVAIAPEVAPVTADVPATPAVPSPTGSGDDDPAVTRSVLLRLIAGVQGL